jgi:hypothetical protein
MARQAAHCQPRRILLLPRQPIPTTAQRRLLAGDRDVLLDRRVVPQAVGRHVKAARRDAELLRRCRRSRLGGGSTGGFRWAVAKISTENQLLGADSELQVQNIE